MDDISDITLSRRDLLIAGAISASAMVAPSLAGPAPAAADATPSAAATPPASAPVMGKVTININGSAHALELDTRTTLLDVLREHLHLTGTKKAATMASAAPAPSSSTAAASTPA